MLTWYLAQVPVTSQRKVLATLREHRFTVFSPMETVWKAIPKGGRERIERPLFPGYVFIGLGPWNRYDFLHDVPSIHLIQNTWSPDRFAAMVADLAFRQCAGEFDKTEGRHYVPPKPMVGPLNHTLGNDLSALSKLLTTTESGRLDLLLSGELVGEPEAQELAA